MITQYLERLVYGRKIRKFGSWAALEFVNKKTHNPSWSDGRAAMWVLHDWSSGRLNSYVNIASIVGENATFGGAFSHSIYRQNMGKISPGVVEKIIKEELGALYSVELPKDPKEWEG